LLVAGDFPRLTSTGYLADIIGALAERGFSLAVEIAAQTTASYTALARAGACGVTLYQETYQEPLYRRYHPLGTKVWFDWRLEAPERAAEAGMKRLSLGILLGLADPRLDVQALIGHGRYLQERFPHIQLAFSLPRIHQAPEEFEIPYPVDDETFIRLYCALRLAFPAAGLVLSSREPPALRDRLAGICITQMSAGSCTSPGGYGDEGNDPRQRQQFPVCDSRSPAEVADYLSRAGFDVFWDFVDEARTSVPAG
jgi:2-iminoacetate synthase